MHTHSPIFSPSTKRLAAHAQLCADHKPACMSRAAGLDPSVGLADGVCMARQCLRDLHACLLSVDDALTDAGGCGMGGVEAGPANSGGLDGCRVWLQQLQSFILALQRDVDAAVDLAARRQQREHQAQPLLEQQQKHEGQLQQPRTPPEELADQQDREQEQAQAHARRRRQREDCGQALEHLEPSGGGVPEARGPLEPSAGDVPEPPGPLEQSAGGVPGAQRPLRRDPWRNLQHDAADRFAAAAAAIAVASEPDTAAGALAETVGPAAAQRRGCDARAHNGGGAAAAAAVGAVQASRMVYPRARTPYRAFWAGKPTL